MTQVPKQAEAAIRDGAEPPEPVAAAPPGTDRLPVLRWHIERYDRLRASTASRAAVVLSAGAILSAGNAVVLAQVFNGAFDHFPPWLVALFTVGILAGATLVVLSLLEAANVLVTPRPSSEMFIGDQEPPPSLLYNGTYTVAATHSYREFRAAVAAQRESEQVEAAQVELYVVIRQHRHRYQRLRAAVRLLRGAAVLFLVVLAVGVAINVASRF
jgi:hypothetical protein